MVDILKPDNDITITTANKAVKNPDLSSATSKTCPICQMDAAKLKLARAKRRSLAISFCRWFAHAASPDAVTKTPMDRPKLSKDGAVIQQDATVAKVARPSKTPESKKRIGAGSAGHRPD
jgi:hypothetical protein